MALALPGNCQCCFEISLRFSPNKLLLRIDGCQLLVLPLEQHGVRQQGNNFISRNTQLLRFFELCFSADNIPCCHKRLTQKQTRSRGIRFGLQCILKLDDCRGSILSLEVVLS